MDNKKEVQINKSLVEMLLISIIVSVAIIFTLEHFGKFSYEYYGGEQPHKTPLTKIRYETIFGSEIITNGQGYMYSEAVYSDGEFRKYENHYTYYLKALKEDLIYLIILTIIIFSILYIRRNYTIKLS